MFTGTLKQTTNRVWGEVHRLEAGSGVPMPGRWRPRAPLPGLFCVRLGGSVGLAIGPKPAVDAGIADFADLAYGELSGALLARALKV